MPQIWHQNIFQKIIRPTSKYWGHILNHIEVISSVHIWILTILKNKPSFTAVLLKRSVTLSILEFVLHTPFCLLFYPFTLKFFLKVPHIKHKNFFAELFIRIYIAIDSRVCILLKCIHLIHLQILVFNWCRMLLLFYQAKTV